jgi:hypothetical protein
MEHTRAICSEASNTRRDILTAVDFLRAETQREIYLTCTICQVLKPNSTDSIVAVTWKWISK